MHSKEIVLAIDPGTQITGYAVLSFSSGFVSPIDYGCIRPPIKEKLSQRYLIIYESILELIDRYNPTVAVVEMQFVYKNAQTALKLGMARGAVLIAAKKRGLSVYEYAPTVAKKAVVGTGKASKYQVQMMVKQLLRLPDPPPPEDAADALALAFCHLHAAPHIRTKREV